MIGIITTEDHGDRHHVTDITAAQQQPGNPGPAENSTKLIDKIIG